MRVRFALFSHLKIDQKRASHADARAKLLAFVYYHNLHYYMYVYRVDLMPSDRRGNLTM